MNGMRACVGMLSAGGSPAQWCRGLERVTAEVAAIDAFVQATSAAAGAVPSLVDGPLLGATLAELTDCPPAAEGDDLQRVDRPGLLDRSTPPSAPPPRPPSQPSRRRGVRRMAADSPSPAPAPPRLAAGQGLASRVSTDRLRSLAGDLPLATGVRRSSPELIEPTPRPAAPPEPPRLRGVRQVSPPELIEPKPSPTGETPGKSRPAAVPCPEPDRPSGDNFLRLVTAAVWRRVGGTEHPPLDRMLKQATRTGPTAPGELLRRTAFGERDESENVGRHPIAPPRQGSRSVARRGDAEEPRPTRRRGVSAREPTARESVLRADPSEVGGVGHQTPAPEVGFDERAVRTASRFAEQPGVARQDRVSPDAPEPWPGPMFSGAARPMTSAASTMSADDLERLMEQVLSDAARRHGIEA
ncbi:MAG: hypothetical protein ACRDTJ_31950 [Pseudonocardiaceae bacterium]